MTSDHDMAARPRYDGYAEWYDAEFPSVPEEERELLLELLPPGRQQRCLDVACGAGRYAAILKAAGYRVVGVDLSSDQLRLAAGRCVALARCDVGRLPIRLGSVPLAFGAYFHTDLEDFRGALSEVAGCLEPGGSLVYLGPHPCFMGPFVLRTQESLDGTLTFRPGYGRVGWANAGSGGGTRVWARVGGHHKTLAAFLGAFCQAGLHIETIVELSGGGLVLPQNIALVARKLRSASA